MLCPKCHKNDTGEYDECEPCTRKFIAEVLKRHERKNPTKVW